MARRTVRVLLAGDEAFRFEPVRSALERAGFEVVGPVYVANLLNVFGMDTLDILVLDTGLADEDAFELGQAFRRLVGSRDLPIVYLRESTELRARHWYARVSESTPTDYFLSKTGDPVRLIKLLDDLAAERGLTVGRGQPSFPTRVVWPTARRSSPAVARS